MIKKLHLYIVREFLRFFFLGLLVSSAILLLDQLFYFIDLFLSRSVPFVLILKLFVFLLPNILKLTIPMAVLFGALIAYGRLSEDNEITAMKSAGINYKTLTMPVIILVCALSFFLLILNHFLSPASTSNFKNVFKEIIVKRPFIKLAEKTLNELGEYNLYANKINNKNNTLSSVCVYKFGNENSDELNSEKKGLPQTYRIYAPTATVKSHKNAVQIILHNGYLHNTHPSNMKDMTHITFKIYRLFIPSSTYVNEEFLAEMEMSSPALVRTIKTCRENYLSSTKYEIEFWLRYILAFAPIAFVIVALPIGTMSGKGGKDKGFGISLGVVFIYYMLLILAIDSSKKECVPISLMMWLPNTIIATAGICLLVKMRKK
jgi:lipopolysaccharide export system permease protein